jgi:hypothetical protein
MQVHLVQITNPVSDAFICNGCDKLKHHCVTKMYYLITSKDQLIGIYCEYCKNTHKFSSNNHPSVITKKESIPSSEIISLKNSSLTAGKNKVFSHNDFYIKLVWELFQYYGSI